jgi:basic membrane protein A
MIKHIVKLAAIAALSGFAAFPAAAQAVKVAVALPGVITDKAFNQNVHDGLVKARDTLGAEVAFTENVSQAEQVEVMSDYARRGYQIVVGAGGEYTDAAKRVATRFPKVRVVVLNGAPTQGVATVNFKNEEFGYVLGLVAGRVTKTGTAAAISAQQFAAFTTAVDGFKAGLKAAKPDGDVLVAYTNDWADVAKAKEATLNLISKGADVFMPYLDAGWVGVVQAAQERNAHTVGILHESDNNLTTARLDFARALVDAIGLFQKGQLEAKDYRIGLTSTDQLGPFNSAVPEAVRQEVQKAIEDIKSGKLNPAKG